MGALHTVYKMASILSGNSGFAETSDVCAVGAIGPRRQRTFFLELHRRILREELAHQFRILLRLQTASAVNKRAAGLESRHGFAQKLKLRRAQSGDLCLANAPA